MNFIKRLFSLELIGVLVKTLFDNLLKGCVFLIVTFLGIICVCYIPFHLFVEVDAKPNEDMRGQTVEASKKIVDEPIIVNNCDSTSIHKIQGQTIPNTPIVRRISEKNAKIPVFEKIGFQGLSANVSSSALGDIHVDQILKEHDSPTAYKDRARGKTILQSAGEYLSQETLESYVTELSQHLSIGERATPDLEIPPGYFNITSLRWKLEWEQGTATIIRPIFFPPYGPEVFEYIVLRNLELNSVTTEQIECDENLIVSLYEIALENYRIGNKNTGDAITEQLTILDPENEVYKRMQEILENDDVIGGITPQVQINEQDAAIRPSPCYTGIEGDSTQNYESAVRANEVVTVLSNPTPDECGYAIDWLYIRTLEGREGYVSATLITIPEFETTLKPVIFKFTE